MVLLYMKANILLNMMRTSFRVYQLQWLANGSRITGAAEQRPVQALVNVNAVNPEVIAGGLNPRGVSGRGRRGVGPSH
jgi:hypothetical protein